MQQITFKAWSYSKTKRLLIERIIIGEIVKETPNQVVVYGKELNNPENKTNYTIAKKSIVDRKEVK